VNGTSSSKEIKAGNDVVVGSRGSSVLSRSVQSCMSENELSGTSTVAVAGAERVVVHVTFKRFGEGVKHWPMEYEAARRRLEASI